MKNYLIFFDIANKFPAGYLRKDAPNLKYTIKKQIEIFRHNKIHNNLYEISSSMEPEVLFKSFMFATYCKRKREYLFDSEIDTLYITPILQIRVLNGEVLNTPHN